MNPRSQRNLALAMALADAPDEIFEAVWEMVFESASEWQRLIARCHIRVDDNIGRKLVVEPGATAEGVLEVACPNGKYGHEAREMVLSKYEAVGAGSSLLHIAVRKGGGYKLVFTSNHWVGEDGHTYVAVYDDGVIVPELIDEIDGSYRFLVREKHPA